MTLSFYSMRFLLAASGLAFLAAPVTPAAVVTFDLVCVLNNTAQCVAGPSFGTVTITDTAANTVRVDANLLNPSLKFRDMMLNVTGIAGAILNLTDPLQNPLLLGSYSISPNPATFNLGSTDNPPNAIQGWNGNSGYAGLVQASGLSTASFTTNNGGTGQYYVAMHIQSIGANGCSGSSDGSTNCVPGQTGTGSLKIGGLLAEPPADTTTPEPLSLALIGVGLISLAAFGRRSN